MVNFVNKLKNHFKPPGIVIYWVVFIAWSLFFQALFRLYFFVKHWHMAKDVPTKDLMLSFIYGVKFDIVITGYVVSLFLVISFIPYISIDTSKISRRITQSISYFLFAVVFLLSLIDVEYFGEFGDHLGAWAYNYLDTFGPIWHMILETYPIFWYLLLWLLLTALFIFVANKFNSILRYNSGKNIISRLGYLLLILIMMIISMRGGISLAPIDWGSAYHSNYYFANELTLNGTYTLSRNIFEYYDDLSHNNPEKYRFYDSQEALNTLQELLTTDRDSLLEIEHSLKRKTNNPSVSRPPQNVVIILLESWSATYVGALGGDPPVTPSFDSLAEKSLLLENLYASGLRTNRGALSVLCSFPSLPGRTVMKLYGSNHPFSSIADILSERGYDTYFIYGGDLDFDNMGGFFRMKGFKNFIGIDDFEYQDRLNKWGVPDHIVFEKANRILSENSDRPFLSIILTLSNHRPYAIPDEPDENFEIFAPDVKYYDHLNAFYYSDWALGQFFKLAGQEDYFSNTIFILVGDHGKVIRHHHEITKNFRIASLIYCPGREDITPKRIKTICGQVDLLPTTLGLLGGPVIHESWGRDILNLTPTDDGFAFINQGDKYGWIEDSFLLWEKVGVQTQLFKIDNGSFKPDDLSQKYPDIAKDMQYKGRSMLQLEVEMSHDVKLEK